MYVIKIPCHYFGSAPFINRLTIMEDEFIREHIEELLRNIRQQVLVKLIRPYTKVRIHFLSQVRLIYLWIINCNTDVCSH